MILDRKIENILKVALPVIFISYFCSITFFTHSHIENGVTIVHSHPYSTNQDGKPNHQHSASEFMLIHTLSTFFVVGAIMVAFLLNLFRNGKEELFVKPVLSIQSRRFEPHHRLRPPPVFS